MKYSALLLFFLLAAGPFSFAQTLPQAHSVVCAHGIGDFTAQFPTGVRIEVGPARRDQLAKRICEADFSWDKAKLTAVAEVSQADVDAFGIDVGLGVPVVAMQTKVADAECCMAYRIYSLQKPPRLLQTITGGDFYSAADTDFDGRVEIWTRDTAAFGGFENLGASARSLAPALVLRFEEGQLRDVSAEFQPYYDQQIAQARAALDPKDLSELKNGDAAGTSSLRMRNAKARVLLIVCAYLYSGREEQAWHALDEMWPTDDVARLRVAIVAARARGIRTQVKSTSTGDPFGRRRRQAIQDAINTQGPAIAGGGGRGRGPTAATNIITSPQPIVLRLVVPNGASDQIPADSQLNVQLVVDSAGKVRSAEPEGKNSGYNAIVKNSAADWRFIPSLRNGRAVASQFVYTVSLRR